MTATDFPAPPRSLRRRFSPVLVLPIVLMLTGAASTFYGISLLFHYQRHTVSSEAMSPTFEPSMVLISRPLDDAGVHRGDVILFDRRGFVLGLGFDGR